MVSALCSVTGVFAPESPAYVDFSTVRNAPWIKPLHTIFLPWGMPQFHLGFFFAVLAGYLASIIESFGDYHSCSYLSGAGDPSPKQISRGIGAEGFGMFFYRIFRRVCQHQLFREYWVGGDYEGGFVACG